MKALLIDDERLARTELKHLLEKYNEKIQVIGEAVNAQEGIKSIRKLKPDVIFLDIQMPEMDGFQMLKKLDEIPKVIFVTAYDEHAIEAFKVNALDYLLKPVDPQRLDEAISKLSSSSEDEFESEVTDLRKERKLNIHDHVFIKDGEKCFFPKLEQVRYFESHGNYVKVYFQDKKPMILRSLNALEERLDQNDFFRANRKYIVNIHKITNIENWFNGGLKVFLENDESIEISRRQAIRFKDIMSI
ncbi:MAG: LytTR family DNA-binding domain-containing protein [Brumimicrobium sp.]|nr:LytTR family DNA-binding domain-containing protein [Brumimicrobium sp.]